MTTISLPKELLEKYHLECADAITPLAGGHINDTYLVECGNQKVVLQKINRTVFPSPENIMENITGVTAFIQKKLSAAGRDTSRETLTIIPTVDGASFVRDDSGEHWRCMSYIENASSIETSSDPEILFQIGQAFGDFQKMLSDYPAATLHETIENFHNTPERVKQLENAVANDKAGRKDTVQEELAFALARKEYAALLVNLCEEGKLPLRVTHNDTKMSNILLDDETKKAVCVIDLDTVMPGLAAYDFGDSIRAGASTAAEDETDLSKVHFDIDRFAAYTKGFLTASGNTFSQTELDTLPDGAILMTYEVGIRFLADYLNGDVYFKTAYPQHNLDRARNQFQLVKEMEAQREDMANVIRDLL